MRDTCKICGRKSTTGQTCGDSYCQEADYNLNMANNCKSAKAKKPFLERARECTSLREDIRWEGA